jgi:hypothetical protein
MPNNEFPSSRARAIANGLMRTGRASELIERDGFIHLRAKDGGRYRIPYDGSRVLRDHATTTGVLQQGFADKMARAGR